MNLIKLYDGLPQLMQVIDMLGIFIVVKSIKSHLVLFPNSATYFTFYPSSTFNNYMWKLELPKGSYDHDVTFSWLEGSRKKFWNKNNSACKKQIQILNEINV